jgi:hypothetical protein
MAVAAVVVVAASTAVAAVAVAAAVADTARAGTIQSKDDSGGATLPCKAK